MKECSVLIEGEGAWSRLKFESGVHRVQRVPVTESMYIQTSAATVAVLPEAEGGREAGPCGHRDAGLPGRRGGQHVNRCPRRAADPAHRPGSGMPAGAQPVPEPGQGHAPLASRL